MLSISYAKAMYLGPIVIAVDDEVSRERICCGIEADPNLIITSEIYCIGITYRTEQLSYADCQKLVKTLLLQKIQLELNIER